MDYFARLGAIVERAWTDAARDETVFPQIAEDALSRLHPRDCFDREAFLDRELDPTIPARRERAPLGAFGQPGVTVHFGREFVIEVYFWVDSLSGVHDHPFSGLFVVLEGQSVHARYTFEERERIGSRLRIGELRPDGIELLAANDHRLFGDRSNPLIHSLLHVPVPSMSMVIRTIRSHEYWRYLPPSIALLADEPDQVSAKQLALLQSLRQCGDPKTDDRLCTFFRSVDLETALHALSYAWMTATDETRARYVEALRERHGRRIDAILPALSRNVRMQQAGALRVQLRDPDDRLIATVLLAAENRAQVLEVIAKRHSDPIARLHRFFDELGIFAAGDEASARSAKLLVDGGGRDAVEAHLEATFGAGTIQSQRAQITRFCTESTFATLVA